MYVPNAEQLLGDRLGIDAEGDSLSCQAGF